MPRTGKEIDDELILKKDRVAKLYSSNGWEVLFQGSYSYDNGLGPAPTQFLIAVNPQERNGDRITGFMHNLNYDWHEKVIVDIEKDSIRFRTTAPLKGIINDSLSSSKAEVPLRRISEVPDDADFRSKAFSGTSRNSVYLGTFEQEAIGKSRDRYVGKFSME